MKKNRLFAILIAFFTFSCFAQNWKADHVFLIGLDGWGAYSVEKAEMPNVKTLMDAGCYTLKKRSVLPSSSAVNWASMFMGQDLNSMDIQNGGLKLPNFLHV